MTDTTGERAVRPLSISRRSGTKRRRWILSAAIFVIAVGVTLVVVRWTRPSVDEALAAIEAARTVPEAENAAVLYDRLMRDDPPAPEATETLLHISQVRQCRFPLDADARYDQKARGFVRQWVTGLERAAGSDLAEGHLDAAVEKCRCLLQFAEHYRQQPTLIDQFLSNNIEAAGLRTLASIIMDEGLALNTLNDIAALSIQTNSAWTTPLEDIIAVELLFARQRCRDMPFIPRLRAWLTEDSTEDYTAQLTPIYRRLLSRRRGLHILLALKRHKMTHDHWPAGLEAVQTSLTPETLTDPQNGDGYVYRLTPDGLVLYSKGPNGVDEGGRFKGTPDDDRVWP